MPELKESAAKWFFDKWGVPRQEYLKYMNKYLNQESDLGWYLCLDDNKIVAGLGVIDNDFHDRKDLTPNICAVYTIHNYRGKGIAGHLLDMAVDDLRSNGISPVYLLTDHESYYERYGWEFFCMVNNETEKNMSRMYIHR